MVLGQVVESWSAEPYVLIVALMFYLCKFKRRCFWGCGPEDILGYLGHRPGWLGGGGWSGAPL